VRSLQERGFVAALTDDPVRPGADSPGADSPGADSPGADRPGPDQVTRAHRWRLRALVLAVAAAVVAVDQVSKSLAVRHLSTHPVHLFGSIYLRLQLNSGAAFSLFEGFGLWIIVIAIVLVGILLVSTRWVRSRVGSVAVGLVLGGALGNLADRLFRGNHGAVIDFIYTRYWPTFNVADACIVLGAVLLVLTSWRRPVAK
jgi:signal peptidase II